MRTLGYVIILLQVVFILVAGVPLYQPFESIDFTSTVVGKYPVNSVAVTTPSGIYFYSNLPDEVYARTLLHTQVKFVCNRGAWLPVLLDCRATVPVNPIYFLEA